MNKKIESLKQKEVGKPEASKDLNPFLRKITAIATFMFTPNQFEPNQTSMDLLGKITDPGSLKEYCKFFFLPTYTPSKIKVREADILKTQTQRSLFRKLLTPLTILGVVIILLMVGIGIFAPWISPYSYLDVSLNIFPGSFEPPSPEHLLGTTAFGRDMFARLIYGTRSSLTLGLSALLIGYSFGTVFGLIAAYFGGRIDNVIMRVFDLLMTLPGLIFALVLGAVFGKEMKIFLIAFGILLIPSIARLIRAAVLQVKESLFIEAAKTAGAKDFRIMFKHILPNAIAPLIVSASFSLGGVILGIAGLTYLGMGEPNIVEWGWDINVGRQKLTTAPWAFLWPGIFIIITVLGFTLLGDGLRDALDPRQNGQK